MCGDSLERPLFCFGCFSAKTDADELLNFGVADEICQEPTCGAHADWSAMADNVKSSLIKAIERLNKVPDLKEREIFEI